MARAKKAKLQLVATKVAKKTRQKKTSGIEFNWELLENQPNQLFTHLTRRAKVFGGWILEVYIDKMNQASVVAVSFIADPKHKWEVATPAVVAAPVTIPEQTQAA